MNTNECVLKNPILWHSKDGKKRNVYYARKSKPDSLKGRKKKERSKVSSLFSMQIVVLMTVLLRVPFMQTASAPFQVPLNNVIQSFRAHREYEEFLLN